MLRNSIGRAAGRGTISLATQGGTARITASLRDKRHGGVGKFQRRGGAPVEGDGAQPLVEAHLRALRASRNSSAGSMKAAARVGVAMRGR